MPQLLRACLAYSCWLSVGVAAACSGGNSTTENGPASAGCPQLITDNLLLVEDAPDGAAACAEGTCNYQTQTGCDDTQACRPQFNTTAPEVHPGCEPAGDAKAGQSCAASSDCARGSYCAIGTCHKLCCGGDWSACDAGESCIRTLQVRAGGQVIDAGADLCFPVGTCDPFDPQSCAEESGRECKIVDPTGAVACAPRSDAQLGDACAPPEVCAQGLTCVAGTCIKLCAFALCGDPACTEAVGTCVHFARDPEGVGECTLDR